ncbi:hypothetical protein L291_0611 [Acinetobacter guillouiae MSP4-18]|nr:hypothetical protein L291_0611 [Acinetobacter guillouiae MSP4-18]BAP37554.1 hypothetical protein AS4_26140 [Acinetobacter guillouiae]
MFTYVLPIRLIYGATIELIFIAKNAKISKTLLTKNQQ